MPTAAERVFEGLVGEILAGTLRPRDPVSERDLVARFGVSRTPVREAVKRLTEKGFFETGPKGIAVVADLSNEDLQSLYDLRIHLEQYAAALTVKNITAQEIQQLRKVNRQFRTALADRDLTKLLEIRANFHAIVAKATRNRWLQEILTLLRDRAYVVRHLHWQDIARARKAVQIHDEMIDALARKDASTYSRLVIDQIKSGIDWYATQLRASTPQPVFGERRGTRRPKE